MHPTIDMKLMAIWHEVALENQKFIIKIRLEWDKSDPNFYPTTWCHVACYALLLYPLTKRNVTEQIITSTKNESIVRQLKSFKVVKNNTKDAMHHKSIKTVNTMYFFLNISK